MPTKPTLTTDELDLIDAIGQRKLGRANAALGRGVDPNTRTADGLPVLSHALGLRYDKKSNGERLQIVRALLEAGADPNGLANAGRHDHSGAAMMLATRSENQAIIDDLVEAGASLTAIDPAGGQTVLHVAVEANHERIARLCLEAGVDVDATDDVGTTPLHVTVSSDGYLKPAILKLLLDAGADPNKANAAGDTAVLLAARYRPKNELARLVKAGGDLTATNAAGETVLHYAAAARRSGSTSKIDEMATLDWLLKRTDLTLEVVAAGSGETLLHAAARHGSPKMVKHLLAEGLDPEATNAEGETPRDVTGRKSIRKLFDG